MRGWGWPTTAPGEPPRVSCARAVCLYLISFMAPHDTGGAKFLLVRTWPLARMLNIYIPIIPTLRGIS
jgi:hypothetical protein